MEQHYAPENAASTSSNDGNGVSFNNRAKAPNPLNPMTEDYEQAVDPTVEEHYTSNSGISNPDAFVSDETSTPEPLEPTASSGQSDVAVGQADAVEGNDESDVSSDASDATPPPKKRGWQKGRKRKTSSTVSSETKPSPVSEPSDSILSLGLPDVAVGQIGTGSGNFDAFAPENLRVSQDFILEAGVEQIQGAIWLPSR